MVYRDILLIMVVVAEVMMIVLTVGLFQQISRHKATIRNLRRQIRNLTKGK